MRLRRVQPGRPHHNGSFGRREALVVRRHVVLLALGQPLVDLRPQDGTEVVTNDPSLCERLSAALKKSLGQEHIQKTEPLMGWLDCPNTKILPPGINGVQFYDSGTTAVEDDFGRRGLCPGSGHRV